MKFLIIDDNLENRFLIAKTLLRRFPNAVLVECTSSEVSTNLLANEKITLVVAHRSHECGGADLMRVLRAIDPRVPILAVSGKDRAQETIAAGADRFHLLDEWLLIGQAAEELLKANARVQNSAPPIPS